MIFDSIQQADVDCRRELYRNVFLTGGTAKLPGKFRYCINHNWLSVLLHCISVMYVVSQMYIVFIPLKRNLTSFTLHRSHYIIVIVIQRQNHYNYNIG